jgi:putative sterol carrier protein
VTLEEFFEKGMKPRPDTLEAFMAISVYGFNTAAARGRRVVLQFDFSGRVDASCHFTIEEDKVAVAAGPADAPDIAIKTPFDLWADIMTGKADGGDMFLKQKYRVEGDPALMVSLFASKGP